MDIHYYTSLIIHICLGSGEIFMHQLKSLAINDPADCPNNCGRSYKRVCRKHSLQRHLKYECGKPPQFQCVVCFKRFTNKKKYATSFGGYPQNY